MKGLADKGEREEKRRNEGQKGLGDMNPLTHITITQCAADVSYAYTPFTAPLCQNSWQRHFSTCNLHFPRAGR